MKFVQNNSFETSFLWTKLIKSPINNKIKVNIAYFDKQRDILKILFELKIYLIAWYIPTHITKLEHKIIIKLEDSVDWLVLILDQYGRLNIVICHIWHLWQICKTSAIDVIFWAFR